MMIMRADGPLAQKARAGLPGPRRLYGDHVVVSFKIRRDLAILLDIEARRRGIPKSELIREAIRKHVFDNGEERRVIATRKIRIYL